MKRTAKLLPPIDGIPDFLRIPQDRRRKAWENVPLTVVPFAQVVKTRDEDATTVAFRASEDERKRLKSLAGIARMKTRMASKTIDHSKMRWDARRAKFVPLTGDKPKLGGSEPLGPQYDGTMMDNQKLHAGPGGSMTTPHKKRHPNLPSTHPANRGKTVDLMWSRVTKDSARALAELNGVWDDKYARLSGGLLVMIVTNRLKGLVKRGGEVKWN